MARSDEFGNSEGRIHYIEPNDLPAYVQGGSSGTLLPDNITWNPDDLNIFVDLQVVIPARQYNSNGVDATLSQINNGRNGAQYWSILSGVKLNRGKEEGFLTDDWTSVSYQEIRQNKAGSKELLGINSIQITFDSNFYPKVTMNFSDVRGSSLMGAQEQKYIDQHTEGLTQEEVTRNFFASLFRFPYPRFLLSVKGIYGTCVTFVLSVEDFKSSFNSETGNFDIVIKFIGNMYGLYTDIPMNYLIIAPYIGNNGGEFKTNRYWDSKTGDNGEFHYVEDGGVGAPIETFVQFYAKYSTMFGTGGIGFSGVTGEELTRRAENQLQLQALEEIMIEIGKISGNTNPSSGTYVSHTVGGQYNFVFFKSAGSSVEVKSEYRNNLKEKIETFQSHYNVGFLNNSYDNLSDIWQSSEETITFNCVEIDSDFNFNLPSGALEGSVKNRIKGVLGSDFADYKRVYIYPQKIWDDYDAYTQGLANQSASEESNTRAQEELVSYFKERFSFTPTIENVMRMVFAHLDTFIHQFYDVINNISGSRTLSSVGGYEKRLTDIETLADSNGNIAFPPYTAFYKETDNRVERIYPGSVDRLADIPEVKFVEDMYAGINEMSRWERSYEADWFAVQEEEEGDGDGEHVIESMDFSPTNLTDLFYDGINPYDGLNIENPSMTGLHYFFLTRLFGIKVVTEGDNFFGSRRDNKAYAEVEAENFISSTAFPKFKNLGDRFKTFVDEVIANNGKLPEGYSYESGMNKIIRFTDNGGKFYPGDAAQSDMLVKTDGNTVWDGENGLRKYSGAHFNGLDYTRSSVELFVQSFESQWNESVSASMRFHYPIYVPEFDANFSGDPTVFYTTQHLANEDTPIEDMWLPYLGSPNMLLGNNNNKMLRQPTGETYALPAFIFLSELAEYWIFRAGRAAMDTGTTVSYIRKFFSKSSIAKMPKPWALFISGVLYFIRHGSDDFRRFNFNHEIGGRRTIRLINKKLTEQEQEKASEYFATWAQTDFKNIYNLILTSEPGTTYVRDSVEYRYRYNNDAEIGTELQRQIATLCTTMVTPIILVYSDVAERDIDDVTESDGALKGKITIPYSSAVKRFFEVIKDELDADSGDDTSTDETTSTEISDYDIVATVDKKNITYYSLKNLYDRWLSMQKESQFLLRAVGDTSTAKTEYDNFVYVDSFYNDISSEFYVNPEAFANLVGTQFGGDASYNVYDFIAKICFDNKLLLRCLPVYSNVYDSKTFKEIFTPHTFYNAYLNDTRHIGNTYVIMYTYEPSHTLDLPQVKSDGPSFGNDSFDIADTFGKITQESVNIMGGTNEKSKNYNVCAFGVTAGKQNQSYFTKINVGMDNPRVTDYAIANTFMLADMGRHGGAINGIGVGQDMYSIFSNRSYDCTVEMLGCANIMPMMYFQLNNIPMFKGCYMITKVEHTIQNNTMTTKFTGTRMPKTYIPFTKNVFNISAIKQAVSAIAGGYSVSDRSGRDIGIGGSGCGSWCRRSIDAYCIPAVNSEDDMAGTTPEGWLLYDIEASVQRTRKNCINVYSRGRDIKYILIHYTAGGSSAPGKAFSTLNTLNNKLAKRGERPNYEYKWTGRLSVDYIVDDQYIIQSANDPAKVACWSVGGDVRNTLNPRLSNVTAVAIETCPTIKGKPSNLDPYPNAPYFYFTGPTLLKLLELVTCLCVKYGLEPSRDTIKRHYDAYDQNADNRQKSCPGIIGWNRNETFDDHNHKTNRNSGEGFYDDFIKKVKFLWDYLKNFAADYPGGPVTDLTQDYPRAVRMIRTLTRSAFSSETSIYLDRIGKPYDRDKAYRMNEDNEWVTVSYNP